MLHDLPFPRFGFILVFVVLFKHPSFFLSFSSPYFVSTMRVTAALVFFCVIASVSADLWLPFQNSSPTDQCVDDQDWKGITSPDFGPESVSCPNTMLELYNVMLLIELLYDVVDQMHRRLSL